MLINSTAPMEILIADDDSASRLYMELAVRALQHSPLSVESGAQVLDMLESFAFDVVLLDIEMPVLGGIETLRRIRANPGLQELPVYAITAHTDGVEMDRAQRAGFSGILSKSFSPDELADVLAGKNPDGRGVEAQDTPLVDYEVFAEYETLLRGAGMSPAARVRGTLGQVSTWIDGGPSCVPESREHAHALAGACAVMGAAALRAAMKELERLATAGTAAAWADSLARAAQTALETERAYGTLPSGFRPPSTC